MMYAEHEGNCNDLTSIGICKRMSLLMIQWSASISPFLCAFKITFTSIIILSDFMYKNVTKKTF